ncbi:hypothetical protein [Dactylosporangium darangshiense]|uniref:HEAT repeat domain-containing protein n=1 Tax=Dactylosporangium darangshiense TaxID=579108 RepID=A0ABP8CWU9_9ACTN
MAASRKAATPTPTAPLPDRHVLLWHPDWAALGHAMGRADDIPVALSQLTDENSEVRAKALEYLERVNHQNTIYSATAPAALYIAGILNDPWTARAINARYPTWRTEYRCLRAVLLDWLGDMADDVGDETGRLASKHGFPLDGVPEVIAFRRARPAIFGAVAPFLSDDDPDVRRSAVIAAGQLLDAPELVGHRAGLVAPLRDVLANCPNKYHHVRAERTLLAWGEDPATLAELASSAPGTEVEFMPERWASDPPF